MLISTSGDSGGAALLNQLDTSEYEATPAQIIERLDAAAAAVKRCLAMLRDRAESGGVRYTEWRLARPHLTGLAPQEDSDLLEVVWREAEAREDERQQRLAREEAERKREAERAANPLAAFQRDLARSIGAYAPLSSPELLRLNRRSVMIPEMLGRLSSSATVAAGSPLQQLEREVEDARADVAQLRAAVAGTSVPTDLGWGLGVLALFALFSIVLPVAVMAVDVRVTPAWRGWITGLFVLGIAGLITYIGLTLRTARGLPFLPGLRR